MKNRGRLASRIIAVIVCMTLNGQLTDVRSADKR